MTHYLVATGAVLFPQDAENPREAIALLKQRIDESRHEIGTKEGRSISMTIVEALDEGRLNFVVMDEKRTCLLAGEYNGIYEETVSPELALSVAYCIPTGLLPGGDSWESRWGC